MFSPLGWRSYLLDQLGGRRGLTFWTLTGICGPMALQSISHGLKLHADGSPSLGSQGWPHPHGFLGNCPGWGSLVALPRRWPCAWLGCTPTALGGFILPNLGGGSHAPMALLGKGCPLMALGGTTLIWAEVVWPVETQEMPRHSLVKLRRQL